MRIFIFLFAFIVFFQIHAQSERADVTFSDGLIFTHEPTHFKMKFRFRTQGRVTYEDMDAENIAKEDSLDFSIRRLRLRFEGTVVDPRFFYKTQFSFSRADMDFDNTSYPNIMRDAVVGWSITPNHIVFLGQTKLPGNRQRMISSGQLEFVDRSLLNATFALDRDLGVQSWNKLGSERPVWIKLALSNGEGRANNNQDMGMATTARIEWLPLGDFKGDDEDFSEADLEFESTPKISVGASYSLNSKSRRVGGQMGSFMAGAETRDISTFFADFMMKFQGWALDVEFADRSAKKPVINATQVVYAGQAINTQLSYVFSNFWSPAIRYTKLWPSSEIYQQEGVATESTISVSKYFNGHLVKLQTDLTHQVIDSPILFTQQQNWVARLQFQVGI